MSCPDVMFNIDRGKVEDVKFLAFAYKYDIRKIVEPNNQVRWYAKPSFTKLSTVVRKPTFYFITFNVEMKRVVFIVFCDEDCALMGAGHFPVHVVKIWMR